MEKQLERIQSILDRITTTVCTINFKLNVFVDKKYGNRLYIQCSYSSPCTNTGLVQEWKGRKNQLSEHMTDDEIVKTAYVTFEQAVKHEIMEGFKVDNIILFNPHVNYEELLKISHKEVKRD